MPILIANLATRVTALSPRPRHSFGATDGVVALANGLLEVITRDDVVQVCALWRVSEFPEGGDMVRT